MSESIRIWLAVSYAAPFRTGGWCYVRSAGTLVSGAAGGDRRIGEQRLPLQGLLAALKDVPAGDAVELVTNDPLLASIPRVLSPEPGDEPPSEDLDLWAAVTTAFRDRRIRIARQAPAPGKPLAFAVAWAEQAREKAKGGSFVFAIPKPNLAKAGA
ncbi:hypothetical protein [Phenylobacterium sp.]|uniref:hypothetical protein n=1 Tax=Phenylobacterium sp. TaxID=1871053 RepID=UPI002811B78C|nr:hypothetical protein [Phenylobacterium sp.]